MSTSTKDTMPVGPNKGAPSASSGGYIPNGLVMAIIAKALRDAQTMDQEIQREQAEAEQNYYKQLGGIGEDKTDGNIGKGLIAMAAQSIVDAGEDQAKGLQAMGISSAINAGIMGMATVGALGYGIKNSFESSGVEGEIKETEIEGAQLRGQRDPELLAMEKNRQTDPILERDIETVKAHEGKIPTTGQETSEELEQIKDREKKANQAIQIDNQKELDERIERNQAKLKKLGRQRKEINKKTDRAVQTSQAIGTVSQAATGAAGNCINSKATADKAADDANAAVQKQVQDLNLVNAKTANESASAARQQSLKTADDIAQVGMSQVQFKG